MGVRYVLKKLTKAANPVEETAEEALEKEAVEMVVSGKEVVVLTVITVEATKVAEVAEGKEAIHKSLMANSSEKVAQLLSEAARTTDFNISTGSIVEKKPYICT